jgi:group II intron reverse transcriptase/maturase
MRSPIDVLNSLSEQSKDPTYRFKRLYRNLYNPEFFLLAYKNIYANKGSMTPGVDGSTIDGMSLQRIESIIEALKNHSYMPSPARRTYIAKKSSSKKRPLGIPSSDDKLVQEVVRMILESIYEPSFLNTSHGFRPHRSCHTALQQIQRKFTGAKWFVEGDISACFDSFDHHILIELLRKRIEDEQFIALMWKLLKAGYMEQWQYHKTYSGTPQGSGVSPILANIYLHELDCYIEEYKAKFDRGDSTKRKASSEYERARGIMRRFKARNDAVWDTLSEDERKQCAGQLRQMKAEIRQVAHHQVREESYKSIQYTRYADDFVIGVIGSVQDAQSVKADLAEFLREKLHLTLSVEKTAVTHSAKRARFLGYDVSVSRSQETKTLRTGVKLRAYCGVVMLYVPHEKWEAKLLEYGAIRIKKYGDGSEQWKAAHRGSLVAKTDIEILSKYSSEVRGLYNYYSLANNAPAIGKFSSLMKYSMLKTFASKYRTKASQIKARYVKDGAFTVRYETKSGTKSSVYYNKGFKRKKEPLFGNVDILAEAKTYPRKNSLAEMLRNRTCDVCGATDTDIEIHQVKRLKDLAGQTEWEKTMKQRHRKTLAVCPNCHKEIHEK